MFKFINTILIIKDTKMSILPNSPLNIKIIALEIFLVILAPIWILKLFHYFVLPMPFIYNSSSVIPTLQN
jgi:hypothetical protein